MWHILMRGGWVMLPLGVCSLVAVTLIVERYVFFRRLRGSGRTEEIIGLASKGRLDDARQIAHETESSNGHLLPVMKVLLAGLAHPSEPAGAMEATAVAELSSMKRGIAALDTIITLSPLLGLLGTIIGMISAFNIMSSTGIGQPHAVTGGVAEALIATAAGISVAVITLVPYNYFLARIERETDTIEVHATRLELALNAAAKE